MAIVTINRNSLVDIGNALRESTGGMERYRPQEMKQAILNAAGEGKYCWKKYRSTGTPGIDEHTLLLGYVVASTPDAYPADGPQDGYYWVAYDSRYLNYQEVTF